MKFKTLVTNRQVDLTSYIKDYISKFPDVEILVGCDSQGYKDKTIYATVIALYKPGSGAHVLYMRETVAPERVRQVRLMNEVWKSIEVAEFLKQAGLPQVKYIDIDINPDKRYKSNEVLRAAVGLVEGMGYQVRYKTFGAMATFAADTLVK
jgi:predicted RNase H-related nuclease YkuK (DUF458 family)